ncbi:MAG: ferric reductase-like transmembrane domain-containing protein [Dehalococcoidia bacterium]|nr:ferric reductase-like transmembrane domain-containing protein [Dehalococcoidia bacterium]
MKKGFLSISTVLVITFLCWLFPITSSQSLFSFMRLAGALSIAGFTCTFFIAGRFRLLDKLFNGLDKAYIFHKWIGLSSVVLVIAHLIILFFARASRQSDIIKWEIVAMSSLILFVLLALVSIVAKRMRYEVWKTIHKFMIIPFSLGVYHYYDTSRTPFAFNAFNIWMHILNIVGIVCAIYIVFFYEKTAFPYKYQVSSVKFVAKNTFEITGQAMDKHLSYQPGQFIFFKIPNGSSKISSRPITISNTPNDRTIQLTIKSLGDHTAKLMETIKNGDEFALTTAHGMFDYKRGSNHQLWLAGGIGIAPFRSFYKSPIPHDFSINLFYAYYGDEGAYLDELKNLDKPNLCIHLLNSNLEGFLTAEKILSVTHIETALDVFFCGPKEMLDSLRKDFRHNGITAKFHYEEFTFGR